MTCIVLDDEELSIRHIVDNYIKKIPYLRLLGTFSNPQEALLFLQGTPVDLVFLDIEMPNHPIDGIDFMKIVRPEQRYILTTAHPQYALESYDYKVVDYLRKPYPFERFAKAVQKAQQVIGPDEPTGASATPADSLYVRADGKLQQVFFNQICYVEAERNYATIHRATDALSTKSTLSRLEAELPASQFVRVHKSYIVSLGKIEFVEKGEVGVQCSNGVQRIPISPQNKKAFLMAIDNRKKDLPQ